MKITFRISILLFAFYAFGAPHLATRPGWLGFGFKSPPKAASKGDAAFTWLFVQKVTRGGPAESAGLRPGDMIVGIQGHPLRFRTDTDILSQLSKIHAAEQLDVDVVRQSTKRSLRIVAAEMDDDQFAAWKHNFELARQRDK
jgi:predicted metalloprotease with PDZ domain